MNEGRKREGNGKTISCLKTMMALSGGGGERGATASSAKIGSTTETTNARGCRCRAVLVDRSVAVSHGGSFCDGDFIGVFDQSVPSRKFANNPKNECLTGQRERLGF